MMITSITMQADRIQIKNVYLYLQNDHMWLNSPSALHSFGRWFSYRHCFTA